MRFSTLASSPSDTSARQAVVSAAGTLASAFQSASSQVAAVNTGVSQTAVSVVGEVNGLTKTIAALNQQISALSPDADAGQLEDQRQTAIAQLSQYIGAGSGDNGEAMGSRFRRVTGRFW